MTEEFYDCQLNTTCRCGSIKPFGYHVCAACWDQVPDDLKTELAKSDFSNERALVKRLESIARSRNPDRIDGIGLQPDVESRDFRRPMKPNLPPAIPGSHRNIDPDFTDDFSE